MGSAVNLFCFPGSFVPHLPGWGSPPWHGPQFLHHLICVPPASLMLMTSLTRALSLWSLKGRVPPCPLHPTGLLIICPRDPSVRTNPQQETMHLPPQCPASKVTLKKKKKKKVTLIFLPIGHLSQFFASFPRASHLSASIGPPGPCTTWCLCTVSTHSPFVHSSAEKQTCPQGGDNPGGSSMRAGVSVCASAPSPPLSGIGGTPSIMAGPCLIGRSRSGR